MTPFLITLTVAVISLSFIAGYIIGQSKILKQDNDFLEDLLKK